MVLLAPIIQQRMLVTRSTLVALLSDMGERFQRLETKQAQLLARVARIEGDAALNRLAVEVNWAASTASTIGSAFEGFARAMRRPLKRGRVGDAARARLASRIGERWPEGRFMAHADWEQIEREVSEAEYMRYAAGGFARAHTARRFVDGTSHRRTSTEGQDHRRSDHYRGYREHPRPGGDAGWIRYCDTANWRNEDGIGASESGSGSRKNPNSSDERRARIGRCH